MHDEGKAAIIVVNKWDALEKDTNTMEAFRKKVIEDLKFMDYAPVLFISALTGQRVPKRAGKPSARSTRQTSRRITTGLLNDILADATSRAPAAVYQRPPAQDLLRHAAERAARRHLCCSLTTKS